jgi:hypothetical protein
MRKIIIALFFVIPFFGQSQYVHLDSFYNFKFGTASEVIKSAMQKKGYKIIQSDKQQISYNIDRFAGHNTSMMFFIFADNKLCGGAIFFKPDLDAEAISLYYQIADELKQKYGTYFVDKEDYQYPFSKEEDHGKETVIKMGKATYETTWSLLSGFHDGINKLQLKINTNLEILLLYSDTPLMQKFASENNAENLKDY